MQPARMTMRDYEAPGPVARAFIDDKTSFVRGIMGPQGSGKTNAVVADLIENAGLMPTGLDGIKRYRHVVVRDTYLNMQKSFLQSWFEWFPKSEGEWSGGGDRPACHRIPFAVVEGGRQLLVDFEIHFVAIGDNRAEDVLRGFEMTAATLNEADLMAPEVLDYLVGRVGRYPAMRTLLAARDVDAIEKRIGRPVEVADLPARARYRDYITLDFNAPDVDNYCYQRFVEQKPANFAFYRQPSGLVREAENLRNLKPGYYRQQIAANAHRPWWVRRMIENEWGYSRDGLPVYGEWNDGVHVAPELLTYVPNIPIRIGVDAALHPAAVFGQWMPDGQWRIVHELVPGRIGVRRFGELIRDHLRQEAPEHNVGSIHCDPTAYNGADKESGELAWAETLTQLLEHQIEPAPSNELSLRLEAVREPMRHTIDGRRPGLLLSPACRVLRKGFASHYRFRRQRIGQTERYDDRPEKNDFSHPQDALQYLILGSAGRDAVMQGMHAPGDSRRGTDGNTVVRSDFSLWGSAA